MKLDARHYALLALGVVAYATLYTIVQYHTQRWLASQEG